MLGGVTCRKMKRESQWQGYLFPHNAPDLGKKFRVGSMEMFLVGLLYIRGITTHLVDGAWCAGRWWWFAWGYVERNWVFGEAVSVGGCGPATGWAVGPGIDDLGRFWAMGRDWGG